MDHTDERTAPDVLKSDTDNATTIRPSEAPPGKRAKFRRLREYNRDMWNGPKRENTEEFRRQDNLHRFDAIASTLGLTDTQKGRGRELFDSLCLTKFNRRTKQADTVDVVVFGLCVLIANDDVRNGTRYWPRKNAGNNDELFEDFAAELGLSLRDQMSIVERVRARVEL